MSTLKVAAVQYDIDWLDKESNIQKLDSLLKNLPSVDLLLLPETFSTGFSIDVQGCEEPSGGGQVLEWMKAKASELGVVIAGSVLVKVDDKKANRFYWVTPEGEVDYYDKRHLFRLGNEQDYVVQGEQRKILEVNGIRILPLVCYDLRFPVWSRNQNDYELMVNVANWPAVRRNVWDTLLKARAMENQTYVIGVNRVGEDGKGTPHSGGTAIYDFCGETIESASDDNEQVIIAELDFSKQKAFRDKFPAYLDADEFVIKMG
ncbi:amidohydrolase [Aliikangiella coralliicola]|uniref:Omega-amidase YafV n=1 Tax=Aliikangiella coralliicola TaxID=2592383 RepID=A0A545U0F2_9GAMM|nr:amidohydrolase [Aliikangiella coralliicola]TQV82941.1 amidohydrolase [Aliikangiella coralliicola]